MFRTTLLSIYIIYPRGMCPWQRAKEALELHTLESFTFSSSTFFPRIRTTFSVCFARAIKLLLIWSIARYISDLETLEMSSRHSIEMQEIYNENINIKGRTFSQFSKLFSRSLSITFRSLDWKENVAFK